MQLVWINPLSLESRDIDIALQSRTFKQQVRADARILGRLVSLSGNPPQPTDHASEQDRYGDARRGGRLLRRCLAKGEQVDGRSLVARQRRHTLAQPAARSAELEPR